jgi:ATP-dependent DNA helicase RecG
MISLSSSIKSISRVGESTAKRLINLDIETVQDLLLWLPFRYEDYSQATSIKNLEAGKNANIVGTIELIQNNRSPRKRMHITEALISDETEQIKVIWFNQPFITKTLREGDKVSLAGKVDHDYSGLVMISPTHEKIITGQAIHTQGVVPIYPLTANITQKQMRYLVKQVINQADKLIDWLPSDIQSKLKLIGLNEAIKKIHFPNDLGQLSLAKRRLGFNELFLLQIQAALARRKKEMSQAESFPFLNKETQDFIAKLPFTLTDAQKKSAWQIIQDIGLEKPMARLLEGDVGSGKTVVAALAMLNVVLKKDSSAQCALMAPTEILASQHFASLKKLYDGTGIKIALFTRSEQKLFLPGSEDAKLSKKKMVELIVAGGADIIIGTHALVQETVSFKNLALAIIDEQHRFGVEQRQALVKKSGNEKTVPHLLAMTATPIPRSLALAIFGDLDISIINELPQSRKKIETKIVAENNRAAAYDFVKKQIKEGRQVFVICPLIDLSDKLGVKSVKEEFVKLNEKVFPDLSLAMLHGRLSAKEKDAIMRDFADNKINILVSTSVIEVGVDIPNASIMIIEDADRFGLAQLHQFRGRVGRGAHQSYCLLFADSGGAVAVKRLNALVQSNDGFALAQMDLKQRGPGEVFGTAQKGFPDLKVASLFDHVLIKEAQEEAKQLIAKSPDLELYPILKEKIAHLDTDSYLVG